LQPFDKITEMKKQLVLPLLAAVALSFTACNNNEPAKAAEPVAEAPKTYEERVQEIETKIRNTPDWLALVDKKAKERNISLDSMIHADAIWTVDEADGKHKNLTPAVPAPDSAQKK
jgi:hypothetical protein